jgi:membrane-bound metal-dependent hydrolase YbcI (DUF457 family)
MDPVSHMAFGRTIVALDTRRALGAGAIAACVFGSLAPDVDAVFMPIGWDLYLRIHQGGTHSLIGSVACAAVTAAVVRILVKRGRYLALWLAAWAGTAGHLLLDVMSGADIKFFWPLGSPVAVPLFAMADPWLAGLLLFGLVSMAFRRRSVGPTAIAVLTAVVILGAGKWLLYSKVRAVERASGSQTPLRRADVEWGSLTGWVTYGVAPEIVESRRVNGLSGAVTPRIDIRRGFDTDPLIARSRRLTTVQNFLAAHDVTFALVIGHDTEDRQVLWSDLRYCGPPSAQSAPWSPIDLGSGSPVSCALWFGGEFDSSGLPIASVVHVGHILQRRELR